VAESLLTFAPTAPPTMAMRAKVRVLVAVCGVLLAVLAITGSFVGGTTGSITYVGSLGASALVVLGVTMQRGVQQRAWRWIGFGLTVWAITGYLTTIKESAGFASIPDLLISLGYAVGYIPVMVGLVEMSDPRMHTRRLSNFIDGLLLFLVIYGVLWLLVVELVTSDHTLSQMDRAFEALYPAGDLAIVMLAVRVVRSGTTLRRVSWMLLIGAIASMAADVALLALYLHNPDGSYNITDLLYLGGVSVIALASLWSLLPAPTNVPAPRASTPGIPMLVAASAIVPALVLLGIVLFTDRSVSQIGVAVWLALVVVVMVVRNLAGVRELERAHQQAAWLTSHDIGTGTLQRVAFLHEVSEGSLRDRSGTVIVAEVQDVRELSDEFGHEAVDYLLDAVALRMRAITGEHAILARMAHDQFVGFLRSADLGHGRQVAGAVLKALHEPVAFGDMQLPMRACVGVAQADGAVIDVLAGVRRATAAMQHARSSASGALAFDADLAGNTDGVPPNDQWDDWSLEPPTTFTAR